MKFNKLVVKNFGPLKHIELDIKDIMIFIGPQASGKSTLAKMLSILSGEMWANNNQASFFQLFKDKHIHFFSKDTLISLGQPTDNLVIYQKGKIEVNDKISKSGINPAFLPVYIPAERILVSMLSESMMGMMAHKIAIPDFILRFGSSFEVARKQLDAFFINALNITYRFEAGRDQVYISDQKALPLSQAASGLQAAIPLYVILEYFSSQDASIFAIEEPELNLYPETQKQVVEYIVEKCTHQHNRLVITTHSPYILTALNNLIQAYNVVKEKPSLQERVNKIVPAEKWLDFNRVGVYYLENGTAQSLLDDELNVIDATPIDEVSETLGKEFEQLLDLLKN
jgi:predicted ATPase